MILTQEVHDAAIQAAKDAAAKYFAEKLGGVDQYACGFAWVKVNADGRTKLGKSLKALGFRPSWNGGFDYWNPSRFSCQNVNTLEAGAMAYASKVRELIPDFPIYAQSRLD